MSKNDFDAKRRFVEGRAKGVSFVKIAEELGVSKQTLINWSKDLQSEIANHRAIELEHLHTQYFMTRTARIEMLGSLLQKARDEILTRNLADVSTDKLIAVTVTLAKSLDCDRQELILQSRENVSCASLMDSLFEEKVTQWNA